MAGIFAGNKTYSIEQMPSYMIKDIEEFLSAAGVREVLEADNFRTLYRLGNERCDQSTGISNSNTGWLTLLFIDQGIDILEHINTVPDYAYYEITVESLRLPNNIEGIGDFSFCKAKIDTLYIPKSVTRIYAGAFNYFKGHIIYEGSREEGKKIETTTPTWFSSNKFYYADLMLDIRNQSKALDTFDIEFKG